MILVSVQNSCPRINPIRNNFRITFTSSPVVSLYPRLLKKLRTVLGCIGLLPFAVVLLLYPFWMCLKLKPSSRKTWESWKRYLILSSKRILKTGFTNTIIANKNEGMPLCPVVMPNCASIEKTPNELINCMNSSSRPQELKQTSSYFFWRSFSLTRSWLKIIVLGVFSTVS